MKLLWIDDIRIPPNNDWVWVTNAEDAEREIFSGEYTLVSFDHDLGENSATGYDILNNLERQIAKGGFWGEIPEMIVHSANPVGRDNMLRAILSIEKMKREFGEI